MEFDCYERTGSGQAIGQVDNVGVENLLGRTSRTQGKIDLINSCENLYNCFPCYAASIDIR